MRRTANQFDAQTTVTRRSFVRWIPAITMLATMTVVMASSDCVAQSEPEVQSAPEVSVGIEGHYRVGRWTAIKLSEETASESPGADRSDGDREPLTIETRDGDGVQVGYLQTDSLSKGGWSYAVPGSEAAPLIIRRDQDTLLTTRFPTAGSPSRGASMIPLKMPWIVSIGDPLGTDRIGANELLGRDPMMAVSTPTDASGLPNSVLGFDGVDMLIIGASGQPILESLSDSQRLAIRSWLLEGGRMFVTLGGKGPELLKSAPWLLDLLPFSADQLETVELAPSALETYTASQTPLTPFVGVKLPRQRGRGLIIGRTTRATRRVSVPVAAEYSTGFGRVTVIAADLEDDTFAQWPERLDLITRLTGSILVPKQQDRSVISRATAYDDLAGQMRVTLDQFPIKRSFSFSILSLILLGLIAAVGPLDFLLINRLLGKPLLGWLSIPLMAIGLSVVLMTQSTPLIARSGAGTADPDVNANPGEIAATGEKAGDSEQRCNRLEFVDIDVIAGIGRGFAVSYLYTHPANLIDVDVRGSSSLESISERVDWMLTTPYGYPGKSFGGIQIAIEDARLPTYEIDSVSEQKGTLGSINGLPLAPRSSKSIATRYWFSPRLQREVVMTPRPGSQLLEGELINPLPVDLLDGMLVYRNWVYLLPTRFPAGDRIGDIEQLRQKNFRWQLSRQKALEENVTETEAWDPARRDSPRRIAEILMFHDAVGGTRYTSLKDEPLSFLDLSHTLTAEQCLLVGRVAEPMTRLSTHNDQHHDHSPSGESLTMIRLVLPVRTVSGQ